MSQLGQGQCPSTHRPAGENINNGKVGVAVVGNMDSWLTGLTDPRFLFSLDVDVAEACHSAIGSHQVGNTLVNG